MSATQTAASWTRRAIQWTRTAARWTRRAGCAAPGCAVGCLVLLVIVVVLALIVVLAIQAVSAHQERQLALAAACSDEAAGAAGGDGGGGNAGQADASGLAEDEIPENYLELYQDSADAWDIDWTILAAVGWQETRHGSDPNMETENSAGALGPMQFIPVAWADHGLEPGKREGDAPPLEERLDPETAIWSAAHKLAEQGLAGGDTREALVRYYGADVDGYADSVLAKAGAYGDGEFTAADPGADTEGSEFGALEEIDCGDGEGGAGSYDGTAPDFDADQLAGGAPTSCDIDWPFSPGPITPLTCAAHQTIVAEFKDRLNPDFSGNCYRSLQDGGEHPQGRACDYMVASGSAPTDEYRTLGDDIAAYVQDNADALGVRYIIWYQRIWHAHTPDAGWEKMGDRGNPTENHLDHVHVSWDG